MAKEKKKKEKVKKEKQPRSGPGLFSRISLPMVLIPIFILAGASFFALGMLKQKATSEAKVAAIDNRIAQKIDDVPPPVFKTPPPTLPSGMSASDIQPVVAGQADTVPPAPSEMGTVPVQPAPVAQPAAPAIPLATTQPAAMVPPAMAPAVGETGAQPIKAEAVPPGLSPNQAVPVATVGAQPSQALEPDEAGPIKPMWQTVDQKWDDVVVQPAEQGPTGDTSAAWRSINIGQSDDISNQVAQSPIMGAALAVTEPPKKAEVPETVGPPKTVSPKKAKRSARSSRKTVSRKSPARMPTVAIINESGVPQAAQFYRDVLLSFSSSIGIRVGPIQEAPPQNGPTTIFYGAGMKGKAKALARRIPGRRTLAPLGNNAQHDLLLVVRSR